MRRTGRLDGPGHSRPGLVDWRAALQALNEIRYEGWYVFESDHPNRAQLVEATAKNIAFLRENCHLPLG